MVAKTSWHRCGTKRRRGHPMYTPKYDFSRRLNVSSDTPMSRSVAGRLFHTVSLWCVSVHGLQHCVHGLQHAPELSKMGGVSRVISEWSSHLFRGMADHCKKVAHTRLPSVGFRSWSRFLAVSLQVMWVINPAVGCHYFPPGLQLPPQPLKGLLPVLLLGEQGHNGCEQFA